MTAGVQPLYYISVSAPIEEIYPLIGMRIQQLRARDQLTQEQLGAQLQPPVTRASIANIETGKQRLLVHTLLQLAHLLTVSVEELLPGPSLATGAQRIAIESELRRKLDLPAGAATKLAKKFDPSPRTPKKRSRTTVSTNRRSR